MHQDFKGQSLGRATGSGLQPQRVVGPGKELLQGHPKLWGRTSQKTSEGKTTTPLGPEGRIHSPGHLGGRTPIRVGLEGTAWSQGDLKTNGNCPIGFRTFWVGPVNPFFFSISPFWSRNVYLCLPRHCVLEAYSMFAFTDSQLERNLLQDQSYFEFTHI